MAYPSLGSSVSANGATGSVAITANVAVLTVNETTTASGGELDRWSVHLEYSVDGGTSWKSTGIVVRRATSVKGHQFVLPASGVTCRAYVNGLAGSILDIDIT